MKIINLLQTNSGMIAIGFAGLLLTLVAAILVAAFLPGNDRVFSLVSQICVGFQGSLFTVLQIKRIDAAAQTKTADAKTED